MLGKRIYLRKYKNDKSKWIDLDKIKKITLFRRADIKEGYFINFHCEIRYLTAPVNKPVNWNIKNSKKAWKIFNEILLKKPSLKFNYNAIC